ncbi:MAG TPA: hypothetical protein EYP68_03905 [Candidatus Korarchaeota archaeon]|nr:hypothetical protein [Candidatus Korarchaeota archaeon]
MPAQKPLEREDVRTLLEWLLENQDMELSPELDPSRGYIYPELELLGLDPRGEILEELAAQGILTKKKVGEYIVCPRCDSPLHVTQQACPYCGSSDLRKGEVIEHYGCGYVGFEDEFLQPDGSLKCPGCGKVLRLIGKDYRRLGNIFKCLSCRNFFETAEMIDLCVKCHYKFLEKEGKRKELYSYRLNPDAFEKLSEIIFWPSMFSGEIESRGFKVTGKPSVRGKSGVTHTFSLRAGKNETEYLVDVYGGKGVLPPEKVAPFITKVIDLSDPARKGGQRRYILASTQKVSEDARNIARSFGIEIVEAGDINDLKKKLADHMESEIPLEIPVKTRTAAPDAKTQVPEVSVKEALVEKRPEITVDLEKIKEIEEKLVEKPDFVSPEFYRGLLNVVEQMEILATSLVKKEGGDRFIPLLNKI